MDTRGTMRQSASWGLAAKTAIIVGNFLVSVMVARALGPSGRGMYAFVQQVVAVLVVLLGMGLSTSNVYFVAKGDVSGRSATANSIALAAVTGLVALGVSLLVIHGPLAPERSYSLAMALVATALYLSTALFAWLSAVAAGLSGLRTQSIAGIFSVVFVLAGIAITWQAEVLSPLAVLALGVGGQVVAILVLLAIERGRMWSLKVDLPALRGMIGYSARSYVVNLVSYLHLRQDVLILGWLTDPGVVGVYAVAVSVAEFVRHIPQVLGAALFARVSGLEGSLPTEFSARVSRLTALTVVVVAALFALVAPPLIPVVFGEGFAESSRLLLVLLPGVVAFSLAEVPGSYLFSRGVIYWRISAVMVVLNVVLNLAAVPRYGALGAAVASSTTYVLYSAAIVLRMARETELPVPSILIPTRDDLVYARERFVRSDSRRSE